MVPVSYSMEEGFLLPHLANEESESLENSKVELSLRTAEIKELESPKADIWQQLSLSKDESTLLLF